MANPIQTLISPFTIEPKHQSAKLNRDREGWGDEESETADRKRTEKERQVERDRLSDRARDMSLSETEIGPQVKHEVEHKV